MHEQRPTADQAFHPELRQGEGLQGEIEWQSYLDNRPDQDETGAVYHPGTGNEVDPNKYFDQVRKRVAEEEGDRFSDQYDYENMSVPQLAKRMAETEFHGDKTTRGDVEAELNNRLDELDDRYYSETDTSGTRSTRPTNNTGSKTNNDIRSENLEARVTKIKDRELARLRGEEPPTEEMPTRIMPKDAKSGKDRNGSLYSRFKRGVRRHMYETPVDMSPMGPTIQPEVPFEEWYEERQARKAEDGQGRLAAGIERIIAKAAPATQKAREVTVRVAERVGGLTDILDYAGNIALIDTAYYAGSAYARVRDTLEDAKFGVTDRAKTVVAKGRSVGSRNAKQLEAETENSEADESYKALLDQVPDDYEERNRYADREFNGYDPAKVDLFKAYLEKQLQAMATVPSAGEAVRYSDSVGAVMGDMSNEFRFLHEYINHQASQPMDESILLNLRLSDVVKQYLRLDIAKVAPGYSERFG